MHCFTILPTVLWVCSVKIFKNRLHNYSGDLSFKVVRNPGPTKTKNPDQNCEESGVSLERLLHSLLKIRKGVVWKQLEVRWMQNARACTVFVAKKKKGGFFWSRASKKGCFFSWAAFKEHVTMVCVSWNRNLNCKTVFPIFFTCCRK